MLAPRDSQGLYLLQDRVTGAADGSHILLKPEHSLGVSVVVTGTGFVGVPELSLDGEDWYATFGRSASGPGVITSITTDTIYFFDVTGAKYFRVRLTAGTNVTVKGLLGAVVDIVAQLPTALSSEAGALKASLEEQKPYQRSDSYTATATGVAIDVSSYPTKAYAIQVVSSGGVATAWNAVLEGSVDGVNYTAILTHTNLTGDGVVLYSGTNLSPAVSIRSRLVSITLGGATAVAVYIIGVP